MKVMPIVLILLFALFGMAACSPQVLDLPATETLAPGVADATTGIDAVDRVIEAVLSKDAARVRSLLVFTSVGCTNADGLGGPPKCRAGEAEGTLVDVFPSLGAEGSHMRREDLDAWVPLNVNLVYAVYRVSAQAYTEPAFPAGEYAILFLGAEGHPAVIAQVTQDGIVRLDYIMDGDYKARLERDASEFLIAPLEQR